MSSEVRVIVGRGQYRNAVASGRMREANPTLPRCGTDLIQVRQITLIFNEFELQSHTAIGTVEERPELTAGDIVLHVAWVPVIGDVKDCESRASFVFLPAKLDLESLPALRRKWAPKARRKKV